MNCRIVYRPDGGISIIHPVLKARRDGETETQHLDRNYESWKASWNKSTGTTDGDFDFEDVETSSLPTDRTYRNAWRKKKGESAITIDAKEKMIIDEVSTLENKGKNSREKAIENLKSQGKTQ